jgi:hypothetical protein
MKWKNFLKPNWKIAIFVTLVPWLVIISESFLLRYPITILNFTITVELFIGPLVPALFIAASLLLKFKKILSYYLVVFIPYTIILFSLYIAMGALPLSIPSLQLFYMAILEPLVINFLIGPIFLLWLPQKIKSMKFSNYATVLLSSVTFLMVNKYVFSLIFSFLEGQQNSLQFVDQDIVVDVVFVLLSFVFASLFLRKFGKPTKRRRRKVK